MSDKLKRRVLKLIADLHKRPEGHKSISVWDLEDKLKVKELKK